MALEVEAAIQERTRVVLHDERPREGFETRRSERNMHQLVGQVSQASRHQPDGQCRLAGPAEARQDEGEVPGAERGGVQHEPASARVDQRARDFVQEDGGERTGRASLVEGAFFP